MKVLAVSSSIRKISNSDIILKEFIKGAEEEGNEVEYVSLKDKDIKYCIGCLSCQKTLKCVIKDDSAAIIEKIKNAETIVFATPVYFYGMCGQLKTLLDRTCPLFPQEYSFRDVYLIATAEVNEDMAMEGTVKGIEGWVECYENSRLAGVISGIGINEIAEAEKRPEILKQAYEMGKSIQK